MKFPATPKNELPQAAIDAIDGLAEEMRPSIQAIESGTKTTQYNYGRYLSLFGTLVPDSNRQTLGLVAYAAIESGANAQGVKSALRIILGEV